MGEFAEFTKEIVQEFLYNVVFADDKFEFVPGIPPTEVYTPTRETAAAHEEPHEGQVTEKYVNINPMAEEFIEKGIPCSFLLLDDKKDPNYYTKLIFKSDAIILDWQVNNDAGEYILKLLKILFDEDINTLRVIIIYTADPHLKDIIQKIIRVFHDITFDLNQTHGCTISHKSTIISIYAKVGITIEADLRDRIVNEQQLVDALLNEFICVTSGLVSNLAVKSISIIRKNTHKLLSLFNKDLDPAFLAHRSLLANTIESEEQIIDIIGSEIKSLFYCDNVTSVISKEIIRKYLTDNFPENDIGFLFPQRDGFVEVVIPTQISREELIRFSEVGICPCFLKKDTNTNDKILFESKCHIFHTDQFCHNGIDPLKSNVNFALLTSTKTRFNKNYLPSLTLGSILKFHKDATDFYWLCIQPKCDCIRVEKNREFLFLPLKINTTHNDFDFLIEYNSEILYFNIVYTTHKSKFFSFKANENKVVKAILKDDRIIFVGTSNMEWVGELKNDFAQQISNIFASNLSRVGTNHSEWLRRS